jgi:peptide/nickel transport system permease protein
MKTLALLFLWILLLLAVPLLPLPDPSRTDVEHTVEAPSFEHPFGTDNAGRDIFSRTLYGGQRSIFTASLAAGIAIVFALLMAMASGISRKLDKPLVILLNTMLAFPALLFALVILTLLGRGFLPVAIATGVSQIAFYARLARGLILQNQHQGYVLAAEAGGANRWQILTWHILPNARPQLLAYASVTWVYCLINSSALTLLGLGNDPSQADWGIMLATGRETFRHAPWAVLAPALAMIFTVILVNRLADKLGRA